MDLSTEELGELKKRISEIMATIDEEKRQCEDILEKISSLKDDEYSQLVSSASDSRRRRGEGTSSTQTQKEKMEEMEAERNTRQDSIGRLWDKLHDL